MKQFVCDFEIKENYYLIYIVDRIKGKKTFVGQTDYQTIITRVVIRKRI